jgi:hypothetical protein
MVNNAWSLLNPPQEAKARQQQRSSPQWHGCAGARAPVSPPLGTWNSHATWLDSASSVLWAGFADSESEKGSLTDSGSRRCSIYLGMLLMLSCLGRPRVGQLFSMLGFQRHKSSCFADAWRGALASVAVEFVVFRSFEFVEQVSITVL